MGNKKNTPSAGGTGLPALRIGTRVRCTDDGAEGRIAWANAVSVKIKWDDGEAVTWKRADLATKPIAFLDAKPAEPAEEPAAGATPPAAQQAAEAAEEQPAPTPAPELPAAAPAATQPVADTAPAPATEAAAAVEALDTTLAGGLARKKRERKPKTPAEPKEKKVSALDAAARVLAEAGQPLSPKEMIGTMAAKGYWTSPGGKTPDATLASAILREIAVKGAQSRFVKTGPGRFAVRPATPAAGPAARALGVR